MPALVRRVSLLTNRECVSPELVPESLDQSSADLRFLDRAEELRGRDSALARRAHAVPPELLPAGTNAAATAGETATAARRQEAGGRRGAGEGGERSEGEEVRRNRASSDLPASE